MFFDWLSIFVLRDFHLGAYWSSLFILYVCIAERYSCAMIKRSFLIFILLEKRFLFNRNTYYTHMIVSDP